MKKPLPPAIGDMKQIPSKILCSFVKLTKPMNLPGAAGEDRIKCDPTNHSDLKRHWIAYYLPALDSVEVFHVDNDPNKPVEQAVVPGANIEYWTPALQKL